MKSAGAWDAMVLVASGDHMAQTVRFQEILRRLAIVDEGFVDDQAGLGLGLRGAWVLDPETAALVRVGALAAIGSPEVCLEWSATRAPAGYDIEAALVPASMGWIPVITFVHVAVDVMNAMRTVPGEFKSFGHDYRADTARFVHAALGLPAVTDDQMQAVERVLRELELDRGRRISRLAVVGTRTGGASWRRSLRQHHRGNNFCSRSRGTGRPITYPDHVALGHRSTMRG
jgi:hypothetical protein